MNNGKAMVGCACLLLSACGPRPEAVADPNAITLRAALFDVADSLDAVRDRAKGRPKSGLIVDEATVVFNVSAAATSNETLKIEAAAPASLGLPLSGMFQTTIQNEGQRGNQITIKFKSIATGKVSPSALELIARCNRPKPPSYCAGIMMKPAG